MASLVLSVAGSALGPLGGVIGGLVGGYIDQLIFSQFASPIEGPRLEELRQPSFDEGAPAPFILGPQNRVAGQVIWVSKLKEEKSTSGGKGGGGGSKTVTYDYYIDVAIAFARQTLAASNPVRKIWANGQLIFERDAGFLQSSTSITVTVITTKTNISTLCRNKATEEIVNYTHPSGDFFKGVKAGQKITITGCANASNNFTGKVLSVHSNLGGVAGKTQIQVLKCTHTWKTTTCVETTSPSCSPGTAEAAGNNVTFSQEALDTFDKSLIESVTQYTGSLSQTADPTIVATEGTGNVPAFRGTAYVVLKRLKVTNWGGTVPGFEGLVAQATSKTVASAISDILLRNKRISSNDFDTTGVTGNLLGLAQMGPKAPLEALKAMMLVYDIEAQQRGVVEAGIFRNKLFFFNKESASEIAISDGDRGARPAGGSAEEELVRLTAVDPETLPTQVVVAYIDPAKEWLPGSRSFRRAVSLIESQSRISLPMTLSASNAVALAKKIAWALYINERIKVSLHLPPTYVEIAEADLITLSDPVGGTIRARVAKVDRGSNHLLEVEALEELVAVYAEPAGGETVPG